MAVPKIGVVLVDAVEADLVRVVDGELHIRRSCPDDIRARLLAEREMVMRLLTVRPTADLVGDVFPGTVVDLPAIERFWRDFCIRVTPILPDGPRHRARCSRCDEPAGTTVNPLFDAGQVCRRCWEEA